MRRPQLESLNTCPAGRPSQITPAATTLWSVFAAGALALAVGCNGSAPSVVDGGSSIEQAGTDTAGADGPAAAEEQEGRKGQSFLDESPIDTSPTVAEEAAVSRPLPSNNGPLTLDPSITAGLDPRLAKGLRQDPGLAAKGAIDRLITFADLSLVGVPLDGLLDFLFNPDTEDAKSFKFPEKVLEQEGDDKAVIGYMIALEMKPRTNEVLEFMLVKDLQACCFGGSPRPDEWVSVRMKDDGSVPYYEYRPVIVRGDFTVGRLEDDLGYAYGVYQMAGTSVEPFKPPGVR